MRRLFAFCIAFAACAVLALGSLSSTADAQMRQSDRCEVQGACGWSFQSPSSGVLQILRDAHERKLKNRHFKNGGNVFIKNTHNGAVNNAYNGGQSFVTTTAIGAIIRVDGDGNYVKGIQKVDDSTVGAETNTWSGDCTENCEQTSNDPSVHAGHGHSQPH